MAMFFLSALLMIQAASGQFTRTPSNTVGFVDGYTFFYCEGDEFGWDVYHLGANKTTAITAHGKVINDTKYYTTSSGLEIHTLSMNDAGTYRCKYVPVPNYYKEAELIVFEKRPQCTMNITGDKVALGDYVEMTCAIQTFKGKWAPSLLWEQGADIVVAANNVTEGDRLSTTQIIKFTSLQKQKYYSCRVFFDPLTAGSLPPNAADNKPSTYCEKSLVMYYGPRALRVTPRQTSYPPGSKIKVSADSNPPSRYTWVDTATNKTVATGRILTITDDMRSIMSLKVVACNNILIPPYPEKCSELKLTTTVIPTSPAPTSTSTTTTQAPTKRSTTTDVDRNVGSTTTSTKATAPVTTNDDVIITATPTTNTKATYGLTSPAPTSTSTTTTQAPGKRSTTTDVDRNVGSTTTSTKATASITTNDDVIITVTPTTNTKAAYGFGSDRTFLLIVLSFGVILACVLVSGVTAVVILFVRMRRLTTAFNAQKDQVGSGPREGPIGLTNLPTPRGSSRDVYASIGGSDDQTRNTVIDRKIPDRVPQARTDSGDYQGLYASPRSNEVRGQRASYEALRGRNQ